MRKLFFILPMLIYALWGCEKDDGVKDPDAPNQPETPAEITLNLSTEDLIFEAKGGWQEFTIDCSSAWTITGGNEWCQPGATSGSSKSQVKVIVETSTLTSDRNVNLTVRSGSQVKVLAVTQKGVDALTLTKDKLEASTEGGNLTVTMQSNVECTCKIPSAFSDWIKVAPDSKAMTTYSFHFIISVNESTEQREGYIIFIAGSLRDTVYIYQAQKDCLILSEDLLEVSADEQQASIELKTNIDYDIMIPDSVSGWISCAPETRALRTDIIQLLIAGNNLPEERRAVVIVKDRNSELADTLHIRQAQKSVLGLSKKVFDVPAEGEMIRVELATNIEYDLMIPDSVSGWISYLPETRALRTDIIQLLIVENNQMEERRAVVIVKDRNSELSDTLYILQENGFNENSDITDKFDPDFARVLQEKKYINDATHITWRDVKYITRINVRSSNLASLRGIEYFTALKELDCLDNQLTVLDIGQHASLTSLNCNDNQLTALNVSQCMALTELSCSNNRLTSLDVCQCTALKKLDCYGNLLTFLDVRLNTSLTSLGCSSNQLTSLDISQCTKLTNLSCFDNRLTSLDVSQCTELKGLACSKNRLTSLNVTQCTLLTNLSCFDNQIISLDMSQCTSLISLECNFNQLTFLNVNQCMALEWLACSCNQLTSLNVSNCAVLKILTCYDNPGDGTNFLLKAPFDENNMPEGLKKSWTYGNYYITLKIQNAEETTDITSEFDPWFANVLQEKGYIKNAICITQEEINKITSLNVENSLLTSLRGIEYFTALTSLNCERNQLTALDVSKNTALRYLECWYNSLTSLDVSLNAALTYLICDGNKLTSLDLRWNTVLKYLTCDGNKLTSLDVSRCTSLTELSCQDNHLTSLDLRWNTALTRLNCDGTKLTSLDVSRCTSLAELWCQNNQLTSLDLSQCRVLTRLMCSSNQLRSLNVNQCTSLKWLSCHNNPGDGTFFPLTASFDENDMPENLEKTWFYNNKLITLKIQN